MQGAMNNCRESIHLRVTCRKSTQSLMRVDLRTGRLITRRSHALRARLDHEFHVTQDPEIRAARGPASTALTAGPRRRASQACHPEGPPERLCLVSPGLSAWAAVAPVPAPARRSLEAGGFSGGQSLLFPRASGQGKEEIPEAKWVYLPAGRGAPSTPLPLRASQHGPSRGARLGSALLPLLAQGSLLPGPCVRQRCL